MYVCMYVCRICQFLISTVFYFRHRTKIVYFNRQWVSYFSDEVSYFLIVEKMALSKRLIPLICAINSDLLAEKNRYVLSKAIFGMNTNESFKRSAVVARFPTEFP